MLRMIYVTAFLVTLGLGAHAQEGPIQPINGRWDLTVHMRGYDAPSWLQVIPSGRETLVGRFVGAFGSSRPIAQVFFTNGEVHFSLPPQWEEGKGDIQFVGRLEGDRLTGRLTGPFFGDSAVDGVRAPSLKEDREPRWGRPTEIFNGVDLKNLHPRNPSSNNGWIVRDGLLVNAKPGNDLVTDQTFTDFKVHAEFRFPKGSNSGIYLRGRYEVQIEDSYGRDPEEHMMGSIYGFIAPRVNPTNPPGEWQSYDITFVGRRVTVVLNGEKIIDRAEIPGITGGALDSNEAAPGPLFIQGDHGPIEFRKFTVTPAR